MSKKVCEKQFFMGGGKNPKRELLLFNRDKLYLEVIIPIPYISLYEIKPSKEKRINAAIYNCIDKLW